MFVRLTTLQGDPAKMDTAVDHVDGEARVAVEATSGNRGFAVLIDRGHGRLIGASYWDSASSMRASEGTLSAVRDAAAVILGGTVTIERYEVAVAFRHVIPVRNAVVRLTRSRIDPARSDDADVFMQEEVLTRVKGAPGLCSFQLLRDRETGAGMTMTAWEDEQAAHAFAPVAEQLRARAGDRIGLVSDVPETYSMVRTTVQL